MLSAANIILVETIRRQASKSITRIYTVRNRSPTAGARLEELPSPDAVLFIEWPGIAAKMLPYRYIIQCEQTAETTRKFHVGARVDLAIETSGLICGVALNDGVNTAMKKKRQSPARTIRR